MVSVAAYQIILKTQEHLFCKPLSYVLSDGYPLNLHNKHCNNYYYEVFSRIQTLICGSLLNDKL